MKPGKSSSPRGLIIALLVLVILNLAAFGWIARPFLEQYGLRLPFLQTGLVRSNASTITPEPPSTSTLPVIDPTNTAIPISLLAGESPESLLAREGILLLAMRDGINIHLFAYHPLYLPFTRLTDHPWDDISPALSPDGTRIAYSSRQNGYWDIYILDLVSGQQERVTDTPEYEASPTWSPDGQWLAYERYNGTSLDIYIQSLAQAGSEIIQLTDSAGADYSPAWSPAGREIAFVSTRSGDEEIWLARLDEVADRFVNLSKNTQSRDRFPAWSADGQRLSWAAETEGDHHLVIANRDQPDLPARLSREGSRTAWSPDGAILFVEIRDPQGSNLTAYEIASGSLTLPPASLPGNLYGMTWIKGPIVGWLASRLEQADGDLVLKPELWQPVLTRTVAPSGRMGLVALENVTAPQPLLHDAVDEAFVVLRQRVAGETGWDTLSSLENAYVTLTTPPTPSIQQDWLYTGRAFAINPLLVSAGWIAITREDFGGQTYWRVFLRARYQDGSMGTPLYDMVWDLNTRYSGDPVAYEQGGRLSQAPAGYWIDLTELASLYGWERLPSWINWRTFFPSIRFNQFVMTGGLDWQRAMMEIYPPEAMQTATSIPTFTPPATRTPADGPAQRNTATPTPSLTPLATRRPTWTPLVP